MKNIKLYYTFLLAFLAIGVSSCDDDESLNSPILDIAFGFDANDRTVLENGVATIINVNFEAPALQSGTIVVNIQNLTASDDDYKILEAVNGQIIFSVSEGDSAVGFTFIPTNNDIVDGERTIELSLTAESANKLNLGDLFFKQTLTISDDESPKTVNFEVDSTNINEVETTGLEVKLVFSGMVSERSVIKISQATTNLTTANYILNPASSAGFIQLDIPVGTTEASFFVFPVDNDEVGNLEQKIVFEIASVTDGVIIIGETNTAIVSITDDESTPEEISIADLRAQFSGSDLIVGNFAVQGVVTSSNDNLTGKNAFVQDASGGIELRFLEDNTLTLGQEVVVNLRGGTMKRFNNGSLQVENIENEKATVLGDGILPTPRVVTIAQLIAKTFEGELVKVEGLTVTDEDGTGNFPSFGNLIFSIGGDTFKSFIRATSFSGKALLTGSIDVVGIASTFNDEGQITLRQESDVATAGSGPIITPITDIRVMYSGSDVSITSDTFIQGVVTSSNDNITGRNLFIQDASGGIELRFLDDNTLPLGEEIRVNLNGGLIKRFNDGSLQIENIDNASAVSQGTGTLPTPIAITVTQLLSKDFEGQLVRVEGLTVTDEDGTGNFPSFGNLIFSIGVDTFNSFIRSTSFSGNALPTGTISVVGVASTFSDVGQVTLRQESDIQ
jgi:hypothetical protein